MNMNQNNTNLLSQILENALSFDTTIRQQAENQIYKLVDSNFEEFIFNISQKISNENEKKEARQLCSTLIKNIVTNQKYTSKWFGMPQETKQQIKNHILAGLASNDRDISKGVGIAIAGICKIELPKNQWNDIFPNLIRTSQNENINIQLTSVITLGFIFTEIEKNNIDDDTIANLLNSFYTLLNNDNLDINLHIQSLKALNNFLPFISNIISNQSQKNIFLDLIYKSVTNANEQIRKEALEIFLELIRQYYDSFDEYYDKLVYFTTNIMKNDIESNKIYAYEIWCSIGDVEKIRFKLNNKNNQNLKKNLCLCDRAYNILLPIICETLVTQDYDIDEWTLTKASGALLSILSQCCQYNFITNIINYISKYFNIDDEHKKHSALFAFGSILETIYHKELESIIKNSLDTICNILIESKVEHLKEVSAWCIEKICENYGKEICNEVELFNKFIILIKNTAPTSPKKICLSLVTSLHYICKNVPWSMEIETNILSFHLNSIFEFLLKLAVQTENYDNECNIVLTSFYAMGTCAEHAANDTKTIYNSYFLNLCDLLNKTLNNSNFKSEEMRYNYQEYITSTLTAFLSVGKISPVDSKNLYQVVINTFQQRKNIYEEGITVIGSLSLALESNFTSLMKDFSPYLMIGLKSTQQAQLCKISIHVLSDIIRSIKEGFSDYINNFLPVIIGILSDNSIDKVLKTHSFNVIADLFYCCPNQIFSYFNEIMQIIGSAIGAAGKYEVNAENDEETYEYLQDLREHLLETLTCIFCAVQEKNSINEFVVYVQPILEFVYKLSNIENQRLEILKYCIGIIGDFSSAYGNNIKDLLNLEVISNLIETLKKPEYFNNDKDIDNLIKWASTIIENVLHPSN